MTADARELPHSIEAEQAVLGSILIEGTAFDMAAPFLTPQDFYSLPHQHIYSVCEELARESKAIDPVLVEQRLDARGLLGQAVPHGLTFSLFRGLGTASNVAHYARVVLDLSRLRRTILAAQSVVQRGYESSDRVSEFISEASEAISQTSTPGNGARNMFDLSLDRFGELERDIDRPAASHVVFDCGFPALDRLIGGLRPGVLAVFAARPGQGKSSFVMAIASYLARTGVPVGLFWLEDDWRDAVARYHCVRHFAPAASLRGRTDAAYTALGRVATENADEQKRLWIDDTHGLTVNDIAARMRRMHREHGVRVFFADHLGEIGIERGDRWGDRHDLALGRAARVFRDTAKALDAVPVVCSQMNRNTEHRSDGIPRLSDLDGSGQVEQAARLIAFLSHDGDRFTVDVRKNTSGKTGTLQLRWVPERMTVEDQR